MDTSQTLRNFVVGLLLLGTFSGELQAQAPVVQTAVAEETLWSLEKAGWPQLLARGGLLVYWLLSPLEANPPRAMLDTAALRRSLRGGRGWAKLAEAFPYAYPGPAGDGFFCTPDQLEGDPDWERIDRASLQDCGEATYRNYHFRHKSSGIVVKFHCGCAENAEGFGEKPHIHIELSRHSPGIPAELLEHD